jgi:hypothetical protein
VNDRHDPFRNYHIAETDMNEPVRHTESLHVLHLFPDSFDNSLALDDIPSQFRTRQLRSHRIDFPVHLLNEKIEFLPLRFFLAKDRAKFIDVTSRSGDFLETSHLSAMMTIS